MTYPDLMKSDTDPELHQADEPPVLAEDGPRRAVSYADDRDGIQRRLRRIEGQVRGVAKMVDQDKYCVDILTQISAAIAGLRATGLLVLEDHIRGCVVNADPDNREAALAELMSAIERFNRSVS